jgi:hypothetical protein
MTKPARILLTCIGIFLFSLTGKGQPFNLYFDNIPYAEITGNYLIQNEAFDDTTFYNVPIGFNFFFNGMMWTHIHVNSNGKITLAHNSGTGDMDICFLPYGADLYGDVDYRNPSISYQSGGCHGSIVMKVQFKDCSLKGGSNEDYTNFQIWLYQSTGSYEYHYGPNHVGNPPACFSPHTGPLVGSQTTESNSGIILSNALLCGFPFAPDLSTAPDPCYLDGVPDDSQRYFFEYTLNTGISNDGSTVREPYVVYHAASESLSLHLFQTNSEKITVSLVDPTGRIFKTLWVPLSTPGSQVVDLNVPAIAPGIWFVKASTGNRSFVTRFVVND